MFAQSANQANTFGLVPYTWQIIPASHGLKSKYPNECFLFCARGIMFAQSANQANTFGLVPYTWQIIPASHGLKSKYPNECFLFCARGIMFAQSVKLQRSTII